MVAETACAFSLQESKRLIAWLSTVPVTAKYASHPQCSLQASKFTHGQSKDTYLVTLTTFAAATGFQFVLQSQPSGKLLPGAHRIDREYAVLLALSRTPVPVPTPFAICDDHRVLPVSFYIMSYVPGTVFTDLSLPKLTDPNDRADVFREAVRVLHLLRAVDVASVGLASLSPPSPPWLSRQLSTWRRQYDSSRLSDVDYAAMDTLHKRLHVLVSQHDTRAADDSTTVTTTNIVHGDFRIDNLIFRRSGARLVCVAVLDWELVALGNPLADLASLLASFHLPASAADVPVLRSIAIKRPLPAGIPDRLQLVQMYAAHGRLPVTRVESSIMLFVVVSLFRFAAILYGVLARARAGNAASPFALQIGPQATFFVLAALDLLDSGVNAMPNSESGNHFQDGDGREGDVGDLQRVLQQFIEEQVMPLESDFMKHVNSDERWSPWAPIETLKIKAQEKGLWNLFLPKNLAGKLTSEQYAPLAELMGRYTYAAEVFNCSAPDTGNMELLARYGTPVQKERWLKPLLNGEIRSCFGMTEPNVASSDAVNIETRIERRGDEYVINGRKWWTSGAMDPRCKLMLLLGRGPKQESRGRDGRNQSGFSTGKHSEHSIVLVPMDAEGVRVERYLTVFGYDDAPHGHAEVSLTGVRLPVRKALLHTEGGGFEAAQSRLGGGRLHHCMRLVGLAERAHELLVKRAAERQAFGGRLVEHGAVVQAVGRARCDVESMRAITRGTARAVDSGNAGNARRMVGVAKVVVPKLACQVVDAAIQMHGGLGVCQDSLLPMMYAQTRSLRIADGPDEVHLQNVAKDEIRRHDRRRRAML